MLFFNFDEISCISKKIRQKYGFPYLCRILIYLVMLFGTLTKGLLLCLLRSVQIAQALQILVSCLSLGLVLSEQSGSFLWILTL